MDQHLSIINTLLSYSYRGIIAPRKLRQALAEIGESISDEDAKKIISLNPNKNQDDMILPFLEYKEAASQRHMSLSLYLQILTFQNKNMGARETLKLQQVVHPSHGRSFCDISRNICAPSDIECMNKLYPMQISSIESATKEEVNLSCTKVFQSIRKAIDGLQREFKAMSEISTRNNVDIYFQSVVTSPNVFETTNVDIPVIFKTIRRYVKENQRHIEETLKKFPIKWTANFIASEKSYLRPGAAEARLKTCLREIKDTCPSFYIKKSDSDRITITLQTPFQLSAVIKQIV